MAYAVISVSHFSYLCSMNSTKKGLTAYTDRIRYNKELGRNEYDITVYASYFADHIHPYYETEETGERVYDGLSYDEFAIRWEKEPDRFIKALNKMLKDNELLGLQDELEEKVGIKLDFLNFYPLCAFVDAIVRERYFILLKPTVKDILAELKEAKEITITNTDGTKVNITNTELVEKVIDSIKAIEDDGKHYETEKMVRIDDIANNVVIQSKFAYWIVTFLKEYFPNAKRRKNCCMVSEPEQRLILRLLIYFKLAPEGMTLTTSRFRQLIGCYHNLKMNDEYSILPEIGTVPVTFVKYEDWHRKDMDWSKTSLTLHPFNEGETITIKKLK